MSQDLGQELDYRLVAAILALFPAPAVVDVGAERGGFIRLCLEHGARRVDAFEPLDRHWLHLRDSFAGEPRVHLHRMAVSNVSGTARLRVAAAADGSELDHHHSLSEVGGSSSFHCARVQEVATTTLGDACSHLGLPREPEILKLDTEGHDLQALEGLAGCAPKVIISEFWCDLPETSGQCPYRLADLAAVARGAGYAHLLCVRHRGAISWIDIGSTEERPGEWGNVFFCSDAVWGMLVERIIPGLVTTQMRALVACQESLRQQLVDKEAVIVGLAAAAEERLALINRLSPPPRPPSPSEGP